MTTIVNSHNHKITNPITVTKYGSCTFKDKANLPLKKNYLIDNVIYKAVLTSTNPRYR